MIGQTISHYKILEKLGEGGMGVVYKAEDTKLKRIVAMKFLPKRLAIHGAERERFVHEAQAASSLNHPNICTIYEIDEANDETFIVMEHVEGITLREWSRMKSERTEGYRKLGAKEAVEIAVQIADGLEKAHEKGIVHRDVKSENMMVTTDQRVKIMDFGLAKLRGVSKLTKTGSTIGTAAYMSPEQVEGMETDQRTDIFSFGVVLYEMLTGQLPFRAEHETAMMYEIINVEPKALADVKQGIDSELDRIVMKCLEKDRDVRYQTMKDVAVDLRRYRRDSSGKTVDRSSVVRGTFHRELSSTTPKPYWLKIGAIGGVTIVLGLVAWYFYGTRITPIDSLAVLPFTNVGADPNTEYLSDGITESLINNLSQISNLTVMSRSSVFHYKGKEIDPPKVGRELGVKAVLTGRVTPRGDNLIISTELIDVTNNTHIWGEQYNRKLSDVLDVQEEISKEISEKLRLKLAGEDQKKLTKRSTENSEAYQLYLKGRFYWNKRKADDLQKAVEYFNQAIEKDPNFAVAYAGLASTYVILPEYAGLPPKDIIPKIEAAAKKASALDPTLAEPHAVLGLMKVDFEWDWTGGEREYKRAIELNPNYPTTHHWCSIRLRQQGKLEESLVEIKRAQELDPLSLIINLNVGEVLTLVQRYDEAIEQFRKTLELDPNFPGAHSRLGLVYAQQGKFDEAINELQKVREIMGPKDPFAVEILGYIYAKAGKKEKAIKILNQLFEFSKLDYTMSVQIATVYAGLGDKDKAFEWLEKGYDEQNQFLGYLKIAPVWDDLRSDSRYTALLKKIGLEK